MDTERESPPSAGEQPERSDAPQEAVDSNGNWTLSRFLVGLLLVGGDELAQGLQGATQARVGPSVEEETSSDQLRHLALGLLVRGERQAGRSLRALYHASLGTASWTFDKLDRWTDNRLTRPLRRPIEARMQSWGEEAAQIIEEGKREEQDSRALAVESVEAIVENLVDQVAESQEVDRLIKQLVGQKSVSFAASVVDNMRALTATADYLFEGALRKLLRRTPRRALPPSPLEGQPLTMYAAENLERGVADDV